MDRSVCITLVILALVLAGPDKGAAAVYSTDQGGMPTSSSSMRLEDGVAPELGAVTVVDLGMHSRVFLRGQVNGKGLDPNRPVCPHSPCAPPGQPYIRGCKKIYGCG
ncbi:unnamed protein product [Triticum turgidum subsp. durum]|uniref:Uncharacterized protein n=1 Tax=Triticum turgidum subsp. durum TaxID=4567 RepID=A0A9R1R092_TRITD|nr:unnamed protein product [Triticum turgidum subsp. durum]